MYQRPFQKIQPQTTAHLAQTMKLLYMNVGELNQEIYRALNENPALVVNDEIRCPKCNMVLQPGQICPVCSGNAQKVGEDSIVFVTQRDNFYSKTIEPGEEYYPDEIMGQQETRLDEYILTQIGPELQEDERVIAAYILNQLDKDGFFTENLYEVTNYYHVPLDKVEHVKRLIQRADPLGSGSATPEEAIRFQIQVFQEIGSIPEYYVDIAHNHLKNLLKKNFKSVAKQTGITIEDVEKVADFFSRNLNPFPARAHWGTFRQPGKKDHLTYMFPDVIINHPDNDANQRLIVEVVIPGNSALEVNPYYNEALRDASEDIKADLKNDLNKANLFIKCLQQRNNTMQKLLNRLVSVQKHYIVQGDKYLKPVTRYQLSKELNVHESTISRAVSNKTVQLPDGRIVPMASFFDRSLSIRTLLKEIIEAENKQKPYSDADLANMLAEKGYEIARRTVAKYRIMEGILPAFQRKIVK